MPIIIPVRRIVTMMSAQSSSLSGGLLDERGVGRAPAVLGPEVGGRSRAL